MNTKNNTPLVRMENINKWFERIHALKGVDFEVGQGEIVGLLGDNGAGKSTLIKILTGNLQQEKGEIFWNGEKEQIDSVNKARELGIETVYQDQAVIEERNVAQNVFLGRELTKSLGPVQILDNEAMETKASDITERLGLDISSPEQKVRFLSGGERQGVAIARAMYFEANLIILDEPTTALSVTGVQKVVDFIKQIKADGISGIFISHNIERVYPIADRLCVLSNGEKIADVPKEETSVEELKDLQAS